MPVEMARWWFMVGALAALAGGARAYCPPTTPHCTCTDLQGWNYECEDKLGDNDGAQVFVHAVPNSGVEVTCRGETVPRELLPHVDLASGGKLPYVKTTRCSPALLPDLLAAVNASDVTTLKLQNPSEELRPEHLAGAQPEVLLFYEAYSMSRIPSAALAQLPALRQLRVNEARALTALAPGALAAAPALTFLELAAGGLAALPRDAFRGLTRLKHLMLWKNSIDTLDRDTFQGLESLEQVSLNGNQLRALPPGLLAPAPRLRELYLDENPLERLGPGVFTGTQLQKVTFQQYKLANLTLEDLTFANMSALTTLSLQYCGLQALPARLLLGSGQLQALDLSHNRLGALPPALFAGMVKLAALNISHNQLAALPADLFLPLKGLVELNLNRNHIQVLPDRIFSGLTGFRRLSMDDNELHTIAAQAFMGAGSLHSVSLARNRISLQQAGYKNPGQMSPFQDLVNARELLLQGNQLSHVFLDWTDLLTQLTSLDLSHNNYTELVSDQLQFLSDKNVVDLRYNNITTITFSYPPREEGEGQRRRSTLLLDGNPLRCDCSAYSLTLMLRGARLFHAFPRIDLGAAACASPPDKKDRRVADLRPDELTCDLPRDDCPARCRSCLSRPAADALELTCDRLPNKLPNSTNFPFSRVKLKLDDITGLGQLPAAVYSLDVSGIGLEELKLMRQPHLRELDVRNNRLKTVPEYILDSNLTLYLANNSLECECEYTEYIRMLQSRQNINDTADIKCSSGRRLFEVEADDLCAARDAALVAGAVFLALVVAAIALAVLVYYYNYEILVYLTSRGYLKWLFTEEILDADKLYDVFVAYSHSDVAFVQDELMPRLESEFRLRVCVHYRDWVVGDMIPTQVVRSVEQSRKTLVVLSKQFAASAWAGMEFRTAHCMALKEGRPRVVLVILDDDVIGDEKLDKDIRAYLDTNTYLQRHDAKFWERLQRAVAPRDRRFTFLGKFRGGGAARGAAGKGGGGGGGGALDAQLNSDGQLVNAAQGKDAV